jgi:hypothetical protein
MSTPLGPFVLSTQVGLQNAIALPTEEFESSHEKAVKLLGKYLILLDS